jgi:transposase
LGILHGRLILDRCTFPDPVVGGGVWDGTGLRLFAKRLEDGICRWPKIEDGVMRLSAAQLSALLEGLDWRLEARETSAPTQVG